VISTGVALLIILFLTLASVSNTVVATGVTCRVENTYTTSSNIDVRMNCDGHEIRTDNAQLVLTIVSKSLSAVFCARVYADDTVRDCHPIIDKD
jgi:hypothetical protein